jgi:hypothetical protein
MNWVKSCGGVQDIGNTFVTTQESGAGKVKRLKAEGLCWSSAFRRSQRDYQGRPRKRGTPTRSGGQRNATGLSSGS